MPLSRNVKLAKKASSSELSGLIVRGYGCALMQCESEILLASELSTERRNAIWALLEANMRAMYQNSSLGWNLRAKQKELFSSLSRFLLVYGTGATAPLVAFSMFRFEVEEGEDVIYCYELQVLKSFRGQGLGRKMVDDLTTIATTYRMEKVMLTVLLANVEALGFYSKTGFSTDPSSPHFEDEEDLGDTEIDDVDYDILSRTVQPI